MYSSFCIQSNLCWINVLVELLFQIWRTEIKSYSVQNRVAQYFFFFFTCERCVCMCVCVWPVLLFLLCEVSAKHLVLLLWSMWIVMHFWRSFDIWGCPFRMIFLLCMSPFVAFPIVFLYHLQTCYSTIIMLLIKQDKSSAVNKNDVHNYLLTLKDYCISLIMIVDNWSLIL